MASQMSEERTGLGWFVAAVLVFAALFMLVFGAWGFVAPRHFGGVVAPWATLGEHFLRDAGAFQVGIGAAVLVALAWRDTVVVALACFSVASGFHTVSHLIDGDLAGFVFLLVTFVLGTAAVAVRARGLSRARRISRASQADQVKMSRGRNAETSGFGTSTT